VGDELHERRLAGAVAPHERHALALRDEEVDVVEHPLLLPRIAEAHAFEPDPALAFDDRSATRPDVSYGRAVTHRYVTRRRAVAGRYVPERHDRQCAVSGR